MIRLRPWAPFLQVIVVITCLIVAARFEHGYGLALGMGAWAWALPVMTGGYLTLALAVRRDVMAASLIQCMSVVVGTLHAVWAIPLPPLAIGTGVLVATLLYRSHVVLEDVAAEAAEDAPVEVYVDAPAGRADDRALPGGDRAVAAEPPDLAPAMRPVPPARRAEAEEPPAGRGRWGAVRAKYLELWEQREIAMTREELAGEMARVDPDVTADAVRRLHLRLLEATGQVVAA